MKYLPSKMEMVSKLNFQFEAGFLWLEHLGVRNMRVICIQIEFEYQDEGYIICILIEF